MMSDAASSTYDDLPYASQFFTMTHPDRMATTARLFGLEAPAVETCRVLELGCANGGNLLPMAQALPGARFVGIDLSRRQVADGREIVETLGLNNVELKACSILDVGPEFGAFDYVICHGVYSWVPAQVRDKILDICARNLAPNGVAYISYNTYPGWHLRGMVREMLKYHTQGFDEPVVRVGQARAFLNFLIAATPHTQGDYLHVLKDEAELLERESDTYLFHEHLEEENQPVYFHEFIAHAALHGLKYLAPARFSAMDAHVKPEARPLLDQLRPDRIRREQYLDFIRNRTFRQSLICHATATTRDTPEADALRSLRLTALARPLGDEADIEGDAPVEFESITGEKATTNRPLTKRALAALYRRWPRSATLDDLRAELGDLFEKPAEAGGESVESLREGLLQAHLVNLVGLHGHEPPIAYEPDARPVAPPLARYQAEGHPFVGSLRHRNVVLDELDRLVLRLLDGTRDRPAIVDGLAAWVADGTLTVRDGERPIDDPALVREVLAGALEPSLLRLASQALLTTAV
jgi:methyltransferase-like protein/2-polyprenyl-3-methyl-5-hydroxy-6-metoxy-1,4-benzoquinol methylase